MRLKFSCVVALLYAVTITSADTAYLVNEKVVSFIDISTQLVVVSCKITVVNKDLKPIKTYLYSIEPQWQNNLSYIEAYVKENSNSLLVNKVTSANLISVDFEIVFYEPLRPGEKETIEVLSVYTNCLKSYPKSVRQNEKHLVLFSFNVYHYSNYFTQMQSNTIYPGRTEVTMIDGESFKMANDSKYGLHYGPYPDIAPKSEYVSVIHYENSSPFLTVEKLERFVQLSHWGYVTVRDQVSVVHSGPKFVGGYERPFGKGFPDTRVESILTSLPENAFDIYVKDEIGRITSFDVDDSEYHKVDVTLKPRFVLYGGWKTQYEMGYTLPIKLYTNNKNQFYTFFFPVLDKLFPNMVVNEANVNIILPEGAFFQSISPHFDVQNNTDSQNRYCYFMDVLCREVVSFKMQNLVDLHCKTIVSVSYSFLYILMWMKPIVFAMFLYTIFLVFLIYTYLTSNSFNSNEKVHSKLIRPGQATPKHSTNQSQIKLNPVSQETSKQDGKKKKNHLKTKPKPKVHSG